MTMINRSIAVTVLICAMIVPTLAQEDLQVISGKGNQQWLHYTDARNSLYHHLVDEARTLLSQRNDTLERVTSLDDWQDYQGQIREKLLDAVGPFPQKTPLNAKVVRVLRKDAYRLEHIIFESQPSFYVTASLYIPATRKRREKAPAVIYCSGHTPLGYRSDTYQHAILNLVHKGFIVLAFDPVGQGERLQYFDPEKNRSSVGGPTSEHSYPGSQAFVTGSSQARYMIWDGIRAVDYLLTRSEVDPDRIGITGRSGGGTQSAYIAAFDPRIRAAAPECYITSFRRLLESIGPQDAEQNLPGGIARGIDHGDFLIVRAPKPALMITTTGDFFSIQGARETARDVAKVYSAYDAPDNFAMVEDDAGHASTKKNREAMYAFFQKHLNNPGSPADEAVEIPNADELRVTTTGQVSTSLGSETVFSLNREDARQAEAALTNVRADLNVHLEKVAEAARRLSGYRRPVGTAHPVFTGRIQRSGYMIEKYFVKGEGDYVIPYLRVIPEGEARATIIYLDPRGKSAEAMPDGAFEKLARDGFEVIAPDLPGTGELGRGDFKGDANIDGVSHNVWYSAVLINRSVVGIHAGDISRLIDQAHDKGARNIYGIARGEMGPALLHAAVLDERLKGIGLTESITSYQSLVTNKRYHSAFIMGAVPGQLSAYDIPDLGAAVAPRLLVISGLVNGNAEPEVSTTQSQQLDFIRAAYEEKGAGDMLYISESPGTLHEHFGKLIGQRIDNSR